MELDLMEFSHGRDEAPRLIDSGDAAGGRIGIMTDARWERFTKEMQAAGALPDEPRLEEGLLARVRQRPLIALQTRSGLSGRSRCSTPNSASASTTAFATAASAGVVPPSPPPRIPSGLVVEGISLISVSNIGSWSARGMA